MLIFQPPLRLILQSTQNIIINNNLSIFRLGIIMTSGYLSILIKSLIFTCLSLFTINAYALNNNVIVPAHKWHTHLPQLSGGGKWSFKYDYSRRLMSGMLNGKDAVDPEFALQNSDYEKLPYPGSHDCLLATDTCLLSAVAEKATMDLHQFQITYHQSKELSWGLMLQFLSNTVDLFDKMSPTLPVTPYSLGSNGFGDVQLSVTKQLASMQFFDIDLSLGIKLPFGTIDKSDGIIDMSGNTGYVPYAMQIGSGTYDIITGLTLKGVYHGLEYGSSINRTTRTGMNNQYYNLGDNLKIKAWARYTAFFGTQLRIGFTQHVWSPIEGRDARMSDNPRYTGGKRLDALLGLGQRYKHFGVYADYAFPVLQYLNGVQIKTTGTLLVGIEYKYL